MKSLWGRRWGRTHIFDSVQEDRARVGSHKFMLYDISSDVKASLAVPRVVYRYSYIYAHKKVQKV
jgi:hypothetical protein